MYHLLYNLWQVGLLKTSIVIYFNNQSALALVDTKNFYSYIKYITICYHFIWQLTTLKKIKFDYYPINDMQANFFIKSLLGPKLAPYLLLIGVLKGKSNLHYNLLKKCKENK